jgi:NitT/TauT family transport system substrate-binding protein
VLGASFLLSVAGVFCGSVSVTQADEISVTQWGSSLYGLPYAVAMDRGLFKKAGVDITGILTSSGGGTTVRNILASKTPYGEVAVAAALAAQRQGMDLVMLIWPARKSRLRRPEACPKCCC